MGSGLYNPLLMATPVGGRVLNEQIHLQFNARTVYPHTENVLNFFSDAEDSTHDGPRMFHSIEGGVGSQSTLIFPFPFEFVSQKRLLMEAFIKRIRLELITSMPIPTVSMYLWSSDAHEVKGKKEKFLFDFPTPTAPGDQFFLPSTDFINIRLKKNRFYYYCFEFDDLIPRTTNFGMEVSTDIWYGTGLV